MHGDVKESIILCLFRCVHLEKVRFSRNSTPDLSHLSLTQYQYDIKHYRFRDVAPTSENLEDGLICIWVISDLAAKLGNPCLIRLIWDNPLGLISLHKLKSFSKKFLDF